MPISRTFDKLSPKAKEKARDWWRECEARDFGAHGELFESAETAAALLGVEFGTRNVSLGSGKTRLEPNIVWSGFSCQGDGASFEGRYDLVPDASAKVRDEFPTDTTLHSIADELTVLQAIARLHDGVTLSAKIERSQSNYCHDGTMSATAYCHKGTTTQFDDDEADPKISEAIQELMRGFARWIYKGLEADYDYRMSDENVDDAILANEYKFAVDGAILVLEHS